MCLCHLLVAIRTKCVSVFVSFTRINKKSVCVSVSFTHRDKNRVRECVCIFYS